MAVSCDRRILALWSCEEESNAWVYLSGAGWRKLDDREADACTNLLALAAQAKSQNALVKVREELRGDCWYITEIYDLLPGLNPTAQEITFPVSECTFSWTAAYCQAGTHIIARIRLDPDRGVSNKLLEEVKGRWKRGIEDKWSYRFACCRRPGCTSPCALTFEVQWVKRYEHLKVRVALGSGPTNLGLWYTNDSGDVASHEFGHLLGHPDEYSYAPCPGRTPVNTGTVMDDNTEVARRHCMPFCDRLFQDTTKA